LPPPSGFLHARSAASTVSASKPLVESRSRTSCFPFWRRFGRRGDPVSTGAHADSAACAPIAGA
jgi:hypothetical protein